MDLTEPLLASENVEKMTTSSTSNNWPTEAAQRAKLYIPPSWGKETDATCILDLQGSKISVVSTDNEVLDVMYPRDIIGADLELKLFGPTEALEHVGFRNNKAREHTQQQSPTTSQKDDSQCNIFKPCTRDYEKIFSVSTEEIPYDTQAMAVLNIYCYPRKDASQETWGNWMGVTSFQPLPNPNPAENATGPRYAHHRRFEVVRSEDFADIRSLVRAIRSVAGQQQIVQELRYLVLLNPVGGRKRAQSDYDTTVKPMLEQAGVDHDLVVSTHARHAEEYMADVNVNDYQSVVVMGGDGFLHEVLQGIQKRDDSEDVLKKLKFGVVGCGTSNGLAKSILHESQELYSVLESTFLICKGQTVPLDLSTYTTAQKSYLSFLTFTWAMVADIDIDSEMIRCAGSVRYDIWAAYLALRLRSYRARLSYLPRGDSSVDMPPLSSDVPKEWTTIEDDIVLLWAAQVSHASYDIFNSPPSRLQDGVFQILLVRRKNVSRLEMIKVLLNLGSGAHQESSICEFIECVAWRLEPISEGSYNDLDGERIESGPIQGKVLPSAIQVFGGTNSSHTSTSL